MRDEFWPKCKLTFAVLLCLTLSSFCSAVTSKVVRHKSSSDLLRGKARKVVVSSRGTLQLGRAAEAMTADFDGFADVWSINSIVADGQTLYFGTSPNGGIYKYASSKLTKIYPLEEVEDEPAAEADPAEELTEIEKLVREIVEAEKYLTNEHIFAMATDSSGRLLAGISG
ncbi:MAG: hypothetical protein ACYTE3_30825, partial [Planctomycetota bacterium]